VNVYVRGERLRSGASRVSIFTNSSLEAEHEISLALPFQEFSFCGQRLQHQPH
jgi:hypothetical protein